MVLSAVVGASPSGPVRDPSLTFLSKQGSGVFSIRDVMGFYAAFGVSCSFTAQSPSIFGNNSVTRWQNNHKRTIYT
jgi:hypothetical protein